MSVSAPILAGYFSAFSFKIPYVCTCVGLLVIMLMYVLRV